MGDENNSANAENTANKVDTVNANVSNANTVDSANNVNTANDAKRVSYGDTVLEYVDNTEDNKTIAKEVSKGSLKILMYIILGLFLVTLLPLFIGMYRGFTGAESSIFDLNVTIEIFNRLAAMISS